MAHVPNELLENICYFLPRKDLEKCQLVCRQWNNVVDHRKEVLPLRCIPLVKISNKKVKIPAKNISLKNMNKIEECMKYSVIRGLILKNISLKSLKFLEKLVEFLGKKLVCLHLQILCFETTNRIFYFRFKTNHLYMYDRFKTILSLISTKDLEFVMVNPQISNVLQNPEKLNFLEDTRLSFKIIFDQEFDSYTANYFSFVGNPRFMCTNRKRIDLSSARVPRNFVQVFCEHFLNYSFSNSKLLFKKTEIYPELDAIQEGLQYMYNQRFKALSEINNSNADILKRFRVYGANKWIMDVTFEYKMTDTFLLIEKYKMVFEIFY